jgi:ectoine hydroxylase-related dioxygenase (phytanoyl-CoA dioxygenase family)
MSALMMKWPGPTGAKGIHRDLRVVDEARYRAVCVWVPLVDVDERNGALRVLPGSQHVPTGPRSVPRSPADADDAMADLDFADLEPVPMRAGEAVVFDLALVHGSDVNRSSAPRPAVGVAYVPTEATLSLRFCHDDDQIEVIEIAEPDDLRRIDWRVRPPDLRSLGFESHRGPSLRVAELVERSRSVAAERPA